MTSGWQTKGPLRIFDWPLLGLPGAQLAGRQDSTGLPQAANQASTLPSLMYLCRLQRHAREGFYLCSLQFNRSSFGALRAVAPWMGLPASAWVGGATALNLAGVILTALNGGQLSELNARLDHGAHHPAVECTCPAPPRCREQQRGPSWTSLALGAIASLVLGGICVGWAGLRLRASGASVTVDNRVIHSSVPGASHLGPHSPATLKDSKRDGGRSAHA